MQSSLVAQFLGQLPVASQRKGVQSVTVLPSADTLVWSSLQLALVMHLPDVASHFDGATQSASLAHVLLQPSSAQPKPLQLTVATLLQLPAPSQRSSGWATPPVHDAARQTVSAPGRPMHESRTVPSQLGASHGLLGSPAGQAPCTGLPSTGAHFPSTPLMLHASQT